MSTKNAIIYTALVIATALTTSQINGFEFDRRLAEIGERKIVNDINDTMSNPKEGDEETIGKAIAKIKDIIASDVSIEEKEAANSLLQILEGGDDENDNATINTIKNIMLCQVVRNAFMNNTIFSGTEVDGVTHKKDDIIIARTTEGTLELKVEDRNLINGCERGGKAGLAAMVLCDEQVVGTNISNSNAILAIKPLEGRNNEYIKTEDQSDVDDDDYDDYYDNFGEEEL